MGIELHVVPSSFRLNDNIKTYITSLATLHNCNEINVFENMPVISFCNRNYLQKLPEIKKRASHTLWVNCMTFPFPLEVVRHEENLIDLHIYQTEHNENLIKNKLMSVNPNIKTARITPYFNTDTLNFIKERNPNKFVFGRISRNDPHKYMPETLQIYKSIDSSLEKEAIILGYTPNKQHTIGQINESWIHTYPPMGISQEEFYSKCNAVVQTSTCYENWPRVGLEAMASGSILIVYNNDGWCGQVKHNETGFLCKSVRDFIFYTSYLAHHSSLENTLRHNALDHLKTIASLELSIDSWAKIFNSL